MPRARSTTEPDGRHGVDPLGTTAIPAATAGRDATPYIYRSFGIVGQFDWTTRVIIALVDLRFVLQKANL